MFLIKTSCNSWHTLNTSCNFAQLILVRVKRMGSSSCSCYTGSSWKSIEFGVQPWLYDNFNAFSMTTSVIWAARASHPLSCKFAFQRNLLHSFSSNFLIKMELKYAYSAIGDYYTRSNRRLWPWCSLWDGGICYIWLYMILYFFITKYYSAKSHLRGLSNVLNIYLAPSTDLVTALCRVRFSYCSVSYG